MLPTGVWQWNWHYGQDDMFIDCPAYITAEGTVRCALPAEVSSRYIAESSDGPVESAMIRCPSGHWFNGPIEFLALEICEHPGIDMHHDPSSA